MPKIAVRLALLCALLVVPASASAQTTAATVASPAAALAWRGFQACLAISRGSALETAAAQAGFRKDLEGWAAVVDGLGVAIEVRDLPGLKGAKGCFVAVGGPFPDHDEFGGRLDAWARKEGFALVSRDPTPAGGRTVRYTTPDASRAAMFALYPETGDPQQPGRSVLFLGWTAP